MYDIFIAYRTTHVDWVETLAHNLKNQGYSVFLDRWELTPGQHFTGKTHEALKNARCAILVATPDASDSGWVQQEFELMVKLKTSGSGFFYIPIVMGAFPDLPFLENVHAVDFGDSNPELYRQAFQRLLCGLEKKPPGPNPSFTGELRLPGVDCGLEQKPPGPNPSFTGELRLPRVDTGDTQSAGRDDIERTFVCYAREDQEFALALANRLRDAGILAFRLNESRSFSVAGRFAPIRKVCVSCFGGLSPGLGALKPPFSRRDSVEPAFEGVL